MRTTRREFIGSSAAAAAAAVLGAKTSSGARAQPQTEDTDLPNPVPKRKLGRTGMEVSVLTVGTGVVDENTLRYAFSRGVNFVHTAGGYGGGQSIAKVAKAVQGMRDQVFIGLKIQRNWDEAGQRELDAQLETLQTDHVDVVFFNLHNRPDLVADPKGKELFEKWRKAGKARFLGLTSHGGMIPCFEAALKAGWYDCLMGVYPLSMREQYLPILEECERRNVGFIAMKTQTAKSNMESLPVLLRDEAVTTVCERMPTLKVAKSYIDAAVQMDRASEEEARRIIRRESLASIGRCTMCGACSAACPNGLAVRDIVRSVHYYVDVTGDYEYGREQYASIAPEQNAARCLGCGRCEAACPRGVPIASYIRRSRTMYA